MSVGYASKDSKDKLKVVRKGIVRLLLLALFVGELFFSSLSLFVLCLDIGYRGLRECSRRTRALHKILELWLP